MITIFNRQIRRVATRCAPETRANERGMTVLELLIAVLIGAFVIFAAMDAYLSLHSQSIW